MWVLSHHSHLKHYTGLCVCAQNKCTCDYNETESQGLAKNGNSVISKFTFHFTKKFCFTLEPGLRIAYPSAFSGDVVYPATSLLNRTQPYPESPKKQGAGVFFLWQCHLLPKGWAYTGRSDALLEPLKPSKCFPVRGGELTGPQFSGVTDSLYCHFPFFGEWPI